MTIHGKLIAVMRDLDAIGKDRKNASQGYNFRGIDDVYNALHEVLARHGVFSVPEVIDERSEERKTNKGSALIYRVLRVRYTFFAEDGTSVAAVVVGEGMDSGDKASNKAMSVAHKYALLQVLCIPTEEAKDPEADATVDRDGVAPRGGQQQGKGQQQGQAPRVVESPYYRGEPRQKRMLAGLFAEHGVGSVDDQKAIAADAVGIRMDELAEWLETYLDAPAGSKALDRFQREAAHAAQ
jgi:hypothetical protein